MKGRGPVFIPCLTLIAACFFVGDAAAFRNRRSEAAQAKEPLSEASKQWLEEVVSYIITPREKDVFINLPTELDRGTFIKTFWKKRDPNPQTAENEFKLEYYRRIALANKFFWTGGIPGWRADTARRLPLSG